MAYSLSFSIALGSSATGLSLEAQLVNTSGTTVGSAVTSGFVEIGLGNYLWTGSIPDGHRGGVKFQLAGGGALQAFSAINPEEAENTDTKVSGLVASIWAHSTRTLSSFGTLVTDIWAATIRTITGGSLTTAPPTAVQIRTEMDSNSTKLSSIVAVTAKIDTALELDGSVYRFTTNALENAPQVMGAGADSVTLRFTTDGNEDGPPIADAAVWITNEDGEIVAGTLTTNSDGEVTFLLDAGTTYYAWMQKDGQIPIVGSAFVAEADS